MVFSFIFVLGFFALAICAFFFLFFKSTRKLGFILGGVLIGLIGLIFLIESLQPKAIYREPPLESELIGEWEATYLSGGFKETATLIGPPPRLIITESSVQGINIPRRGPHRYANISGPLHITNGSPSGGYSVEVDLVFFYCYRKPSGEVILKQPIDVLNYWDTEYHRTSEPTQK